jgi:CMP-N,N'-diacetyllegionaminic acid synthase
MNCDIDINILIAVRGGSKRVPRKNVRSFCGSSMLELKIQQALRLDGVTGVVVTSDDEDMLETAYRLGATPMDRDPHYATDTVPMGEVYVHLASSLDCQDVMWTPVTSPLVTDQTMQDCINVYKHRGEHDSVVTTNLIKEYMWLDNKAINYDPKNHPRSQDLPNIYALNFAVNILPRELMIKNKNILGDNFYSYMLDEVEALDVDTEYEFMLAEILYEKMRKQ